MKVIRAGVTTDKAGAGRVSPAGAGDQQTRRHGPHVSQRGAAGGERLK